MSKHQIPVGVSLSGGGFRATLFSLGVLYYFVDSGLAKSLRSVVSVSGGSVANAFVAQECDLTRVSSDEFESIVRRMATRIGATGLLGTGPAIAWLLSLGVAAIIAAIGVILLPTTLLRLAALALAIIALGLILHLRGFALGYAMKRAFFSKNGRATQLRDLSRPGVRHAIVATEMISGEPVFFESHVAHGPGLLRCYGDCSRIPANVAVRWSCTVPALLPPGAMPAKRLRLQAAIDGEVPNVPRTFVLMDGGVCNNLGTDYFREANAASFGTRSKPLYTMPAVEQWFVVDASGRLGKAGGGYAGIPVIGEIMSLTRSMSILYENTIRPRTELGTPIISIHRQPMAQMQEGFYKTASLDQRKRSVQLRQYFREHLETHHDEAGPLEELSIRTSRVPTTFGRLDQDTMAYLLWHGYLSALCVAYTVLAVKPPPRLCDRTIYHFRRMVSMSSASVDDPWSGSRHSCDLSRTTDRQEHRSA